MIGGYYHSWTDPHKSILAPKIVRTLIFKATRTIVELGLLIAVAIATTYSRGH